MKPGNRLSPDLKPNTTHGSFVKQDSQGVWHLQIPAGTAGHYRLAQLDDYNSLARNAFPWEAPCNLSLEAQASSNQTIPGTWGFGLWNDPFSLSIGLGGGVRRTPALPNTAWFFFAPPPNYLSLRDDLPATGNLAATFRSPHWSPILLAGVGLCLPLVAVPAIARRLRRLARRYIQQDTTRLQVDPSEWHTYQIDWHREKASFFIDGTPILQTPVSPQGPLGLVLWIDNQFAALPPDGHFRYGTLDNPDSAWVEIRCIHIYRSNQ